MPKNQQQLTQKQLDVLKWVRDGCPEGVYTDGWEHRISARALERRGLVSIGGRGPTWVATITSDGRAWLASPPVADVLPDESEADRLIDQVLEAGGSLAISGTAEELKPWERLVRLSLKSPKRPKGKQLAITRVGNWWGDDREIAFTEYFEDLVTTAAVPVPERVGKYHPVVKAYLDDKHWQLVSKDHLSRAARILHAVAVEAERRGMQVIEPSKAKKNKEHPKYKPVAGHLWLVTTYGEYSVVVKEIAGTGGAKRQYYGSYPASTPKWINQRSTEFISTGRLELILDGPIAPYKGQSFRDAKTKVVEEKLPDVFACLDKYGLESQWREQERIRKEAEQQRRWEAAMVKAKASYFRHARWEHFKALSKKSTTLVGYRRFLASAVEAVDALPGDEQAEASAYLADMRATIDELDPLASPGLIVPKVPEPKPEDLQPFLGGWNPYGPTR